MLKEKTDRFAVHFNPTPDQGTTAREASDKKAASMREYRDNLRLLKGDETTKDDILNHDNALSKMQELQLGIRGLEGDGIEPDSDDPAAAKPIKKVAKIKKRNNKDSESSEVDT